MRKTLILNIALIVAIASIAFSCIEPYDLPNVSEDFVSSLVIDATMSSDDSTQTIMVSQTRALDDNNSDFIDPVSGCIISVEDKDGNIFNFTETSNEGYYQGVVPLQYFYVGNTFQLHLTSPNDDVYESEVEELLPVAPVDSIYFSPIYNSQGNEISVRFKVDVNASLSDCRNYKWKLEETYEYHASYPRNYIYKGPNRVEKLDYDMSRYTCYTKRALSGKIYMVSTEKLSENRFIGVALNNVNHTTGKLLNKYSLLVKQYSLSKSAARFWSQMQDNQEDGGMFDGQPITVDGNIININNTDERVLGYFGASMVSQRRVFAQRSSNLYNAGCISTTLSDYELDSLIQVSSSSRPLYVVVYEGGPGEIIEQFTARASCFDCTLRGGSTSKPNYWDDESITFLLNGVE